LTGFVFLIHISFYNRFIDMISNLIEIFIAV